MSDERGPNDAEPARPVLRVVSGNPTAEEIAVLTALVASSSGESEGSSTAALRGTWKDPARLHRRPLTPGPNAWRSSGW